MPQLFKNNAFSILAANIDSSATTLTVTAGHGNRFPVADGSDWFVITLEDLRGNIEIVKCTSRPAGSDTFVIERAQEGTVARDWQVGDTVSLRLTAGGIAAIMSGMFGHTLVPLSSAYTVVPNDRGKLFDAIGGTWTLNLTTAVAFDPGFVFAVRNSGTGIITIDPYGGELIDGKISIKLYAGDSCTVVNTGAAWRTINLTRASPMPIFRVIQLTSGTTYVPTPGTDMLFVMVYGATGGPQNVALGRGGCGGAGYAEKIYMAPLASSYSYTIGAGGAPGSAGGTTTFDTITVTGGGSTTNNEGGAGGVATGGDFNANGGAGGNIAGYVCGGAGGGAAGGRHGNGYAGGDASNASGGGGGGGSGGPAEFCNNNTPIGRRGGRAATVPSPNATVFLGNRYGGHFIAYPGESGTNYDYYGGDRYGRGGRGAPGTPYLLAGFNIPFVPGGLGGSGYNNSNGAYGESGRIIIYEVSL